MRENRERKNLFLNLFVDFESLSTFNPFEGHHFFFLSLSLFLSISLSLFLSNSYSFFWKRKREKEDWNVFKCDSCVRINREGKKLFGFVFKILLHPFLFLFHSSLSFFSLSLSLIFFSLSPLFSLSHFSLLLFTTREKVISFSGFLSFSFLFFVSHSFLRKRWTWTTSFFVLFFLLSFSLIFFPIHFQGQSFSFVLPVNSSLFQREREKWRKKEKDSLPEFFPLLNFLSPFFLLSFDFLLVHQMIPFFFQFNNLAIQLSFSLALFLSFFVLSFIWTWLDLCTFFFVHFLSSSFFHSFLLTTFDSIFCIPSFSLSLLSSFSLFTFFSFFLSSPSLAFFFHFLQ